jgi:hypothetical protein
MANEMAAVRDLTCYRLGFRIEAVCACWENGGRWPAEAAARRERPTTPTRAR